MEKIFIIALNIVVCFVIGIILISIFGAFRKRLNKKRVLQAITDLCIEEDLASCVAGCNARCTVLINQYFAKHGWDMQFVGGSDNLYLCGLISELRTEGKLKPVYGNLMSMKKKSDGHKNAVMLRNAKEPDIRSKMEEYISRWGFREGIEINMFNLTQRRLDELKKFYALARDTIVSPENIIQWEPSEKYYVTIRGYVLLVDYDKMREMAIDLECTCGSLYKLIALPESYVNEHLHDSERRNEVV